MSKAQRFGVLSKIVERDNWIIWISNRLGRCAINHQHHAKILYFRVNEIISDLEYMFIHLVECATNSKVSHINQNHRNMIRSKCDFTNTN